MSTKTAISHIPILAFKLATKLFTTMHWASRPQTLGDIPRWVLCCHSNETRASIANLPDSAQLEGTPTIPPAKIRSVQYCGNAARDRQTHIRAWPIYISHQPRLTRNITITTAGIVRPIDMRPHAHLNHIV